MYLRVYLCVYVFMCLCVYVFVFGSKIMCRVFTIRQQNKIGFNRRPLKLKSLTLKYQCRLV
jgi:hypothetical protein